MRRSRGELAVSSVEDLVAAAVAAAADLAADRVGSIGVIVPDARLRSLTTALESAGISFALLGAPLQEEVREDPTPQVGGREFAAKIDVVPASLSKGLEFDHVLLCEPTAVVTGEADHITGLRRLYVCLTRAVTSLLVLHVEELPAELGNPEAGSGPAR